MTVGEGLDVCRRCVPALWSGVRRRGVLFFRLMWSTVVMRVIAPPPGPTSKLHSFRNEEDANTERRVLEQPST